MYKSPSPLGRPMVVTLELSCPCNVVWTVVVALRVGAWVTDTALRLWDVWVALVDVDEDEEDEVVDVFQAGGPAREAKDFVFWTDAVGCFRLCPWGDLGL